jgi:hypothetical protein
VGCSRRSISSTTALSDVVRLAGAVLGLRRSGTQTRASARPARIPNLAPLPAAVAALLEPADHDLLPRMRGSTRSVSVCTLAGTDGALRRVGPFKSG